MGKAIATVITLAAKHHRGDIYLKLEKIAPQAKPFPLSPSNTPDSPQRHSSECEG